MLSQDTLSTDGTSQVQHSAKQCSHSSFRRFLHRSCVTLCQTLQPRRVSSYAFKGNTNLAKFALDKGNASLAKFALDKGNRSQARFALRREQRKPNQVRSATEATQAKSKCAVLSKGTLSQVKRRGVKSGCAKPSQRALN